MNKLIFGLILYIVVAAVALLAFPLQESFALTQCQVVYGGGQICQGQQFVRYTYPTSNQPANPTPTPTAIPVPPTTSLPSTGTSFWSLLLIGASGIGGALLLLL